MSAFHGMVKSVGCNSNSLDYYRLIIGILCSTREREGEREGGRERERERERERDPTESVSLPL